MHANDHSELTDEERDLVMFILTVQKAGLVCRSISCEIDFESVRVTYRAEVGGASTTGDHLRRE